MKGGENGTEHCHEVERVKQMKQILNNAMKQEDKELEKGGEKQTQIHCIVQIHVQSNMYI